MPHRFSDLASALHHGTPVCDRFLAAAGAGFALASTWLEAMTGWIGLAVGLATLAMLIPRAILGWHEVARVRAERRRRREEALQMLDSARGDCEGCGEE